MFAIYMLDCTIAFLVLVILIDIMIYFLNGFLVIMLILDLLFWFVLFMIL